MEFKKLFIFGHHPFSSSVSLTRRLLSGFGFGLLASLLIFSLLSILNASPPFFTLSSASSFFSRFLSSPSPDLGMTQFSNATLDDAHNSTRLESAQDWNSSQACPAGRESGFAIAPSGISSSPEHQNPILVQDQNANVTTEKNISKDDDMQRPSVDATAERRNESDSGSKKAMGEFSKDCDIFDGKWVRDERQEPMYPGGSCPFIDIDFDCHRNGRPDDEFLRWRWQPIHCNIPRLNATDLLARLRDKRLIFVGDSLNRNMWESLLCILRDSIKRKDRVYKANERYNFKSEDFYIFRFEDYNCSIDFVKSNFLVRELHFKNANGTDAERLKLDLLDEMIPAYREADIIVFNTGHWWTHEKTSRGIDYYQEGDHVYPVLTVMEAFKKALTTWAKWVDENIDSSKTQVVFRGYSASHFSAGQWNSGGQCHKETEPIFNDAFLEKYPTKMRALEEVLGQMKTPVIYLNISRLTDYRKDGHPSIYRKTYNTAQEQKDAVMSQDCSHWCLPGIPDTWNDLLYASLLLNGKG